MRVCKIIFCSLFFALTTCAQPIVTKTGLFAEQKTATSGNHYTVMHKGSNKIKFTTTRPNKKDTSVLLCNAAAFTNLEDGKVDGAYAIEGKIKQAKVNRRLGGALWIFKTGCEMLGYTVAEDGKLAEGVQGEIKSNKASFFQQIQIIVNGKAEKFKDDKLFQRRAIVIFNNKEIAIIESKEDITLATFSNDLVGLGAYNALYTDMGGWDEGWYRDEKGKIVVIGNMRSQTAKQSNWVVFTK